MSAVQAIIVQGQMSDKPRAIIMYLPARELYYGIAHTPQSPKMPITDFDVIEVLATLDAWMSAVGSEEITYYGTFDIGNQYDAWRRELLTEIAGLHGRSWSCVRTEVSHRLLAMPLIRSRRYFRTFEPLQREPGGLQNE